MAAAYGMLLAWLVLIGSLGTLWAQDGVIQTVLLINSTDYDIYSSFLGGLPLDRGYQLFMERFEELHPDGIPIGNGPHRFVFNYSTVMYDGPGAEVPSLRQVAREQVAQGAHFLFGLGDPSLGLVAGEFNRITLDCCFSDDEEGRRDWYFQMYPPFENDLENLMNAIALKGMRNISLVIETDYGGSAGCVLAREKAPEFLAGGFQFVFIGSENSSVLNNSAAMARIVERMREAHTEFVSACLHPDRATLFIEEAWQAELPLKGRFMGSGPTIPEWVDNLGPMALDVLTFADWHHTINLTNLALFESVEEFVELLEGVDGKRVDFTFPAQTASFYVLMSAIQKAFEGCNTTETAGDVNLLLNDTSAISCDKGKALGYDRVLETLELSDFEGTILGPVKFDKNHRNIGLGSITIQVVNNSGSFETVVVLPLSIANSSHALKIPGSNPFKPERCPKGTFRGPDEFNPCPKCPPGTFSGEEGRDLCQECGSDEYTDRGEGQTGCIPCPENTERRAGGGFDFCEFRDSHGSIFCESCTLDLGDENITCLNCEETSSGDRARGVSICDCECVPGFYDPQRRAGRDCKECPDGAECEGHRELPYPLAGYWGNSSFRDEMYVCDLPKACKGGKNFSDLCTEEYTGRLCADCQSGYFKIVEHCFECMSTASTVMLMVIVFAMWLIINSVVALRVETVELMLNFVQLANIIGSLPLEWPKSLRQVFGVASILDFDVDVVEPSCFASWSFTNNFFVQLGLPIVMSFLALLWFLLGVLRFYTSKWYLQAHNHFVEWFRAATVYQWDVRRTSFRGESFISMEFDKFVAHCMAAIEVTYLTTTRYCLDVLACTDVAGVSVLTASPETVCGSDKHETLRGFAIAGLILYTGGYLAFVVFQLTTMQQTKSFKLSSNIRRYGFVYERFELEYTWTAVLTLLVRIFFVAAMVHVSSPLSAVGIITVVTMVWLFVHVYTLPYVKDELDLLQSFFLVCLAAFAMSGLMFSCKSLPSTARTILTRGVLVLVFIMCAITFFFFLMEIFRKICIWAIKRRHRKAVAAAVASGQVLVHGANPRGDHRHMELYSTVDSTFLYRWLRYADQKKLLQFDRLAAMLGNYLCDDAHCSYLSLETAAKFWRGLALAFPELIDFLAMSSEEDRGQFVHIVEVLYRNFFLTKQIGEDNLWSHIDWKDRAALMQWLAIASQEERQLFGSMIADGVRHNTADAAGERLARKLEQHSKGNYVPTADSSSSARGGILQRTLSTFSRAGASQSVWSEISSGRGPFPPTSLEPTRAGNGNLSAADGEGSALDLAPNDSNSRVRLLASARISKSGPSDSEPHQKGKKGAPV